MFYKTINRLSCKKYQHKANISYQSFKIDEIHRNEKTSRLIFSLKKLQAE